MNWNMKSFNDLTVEELYEILELRTNIFVVEQNCPYPEIDGKDKKAKHLFLKDGRKIVAYLRILQKGVSFDEISFGRVVVDKKYRGKGIAKELLIKAIQYTEEEMKEKTVRIEAQSYAKPLYESVGFKKISEEFIMDGIPHIEMLLNIKEIDIHRSQTTDSSNSKERK